MSVGPVVGQIVYLAGPSSTGKSKYSSELIANGWLHFEADHFLSVTEIKHVEKALGQQLDLIKKSLTEEHCTPERILGVIMGDKPEIAPEELQSFEEARSLIKACLDERWTTLGKPDESKAQTNWKEIFIAMLEESVKASTRGKNVIIDFVGMINERPEVSAPGLKLVQESPNIWDYKGVKIEQFLKYATITRLAQNIFRRNQQIDNQRDPLYVLTQYGERFIKAKAGDEAIGNIETEELTRWIERFVKIEHFKLSYQDENNIDALIHEKMKTIDPQELELIAHKVEEETNKLFKLMGIEEGDVQIPLTYRTNDGAKPTIINN